MLDAGDTFFFNVARSHLWIVLAPPSGPAGSFVIVNVSTDRGAGAEDRSCVLSQGDHPALTHSSAVRYGDAREWREAGPNGFLDLQAQGGVTVRPSLASEVLARVHRGALVSPHIEPRFRELVRDLLEPEL